MNIINGYKNPAFSILKSIDRSTTNINLPLTNTDGLIETYEMLKVSHEFCDYSFETQLMGFRIHFTLNYSQYITGTALLSIRQVLIAAKNGDTIYIIPRADKPLRQYEVVVSMDNFELGLLKGGASSPGHKLPVLTFTTKYLQTDLGWEEESIANCES
jgi:hypothetical protein